LRLFYRDREAQVLTLFGYQCRNAEGYLRGCDLRLVVKGFCFFSMCDRKQLMFYAVSVATELFPRSVSGKPYVTTRTVAFFKFWIASFVV
jgi:hypothetical protein